MRAEGNIIETITSHFDLHQLIHDPTHILGKPLSCIDSIFTSQTNMVVNSGVPFSLLANCHQQILFTKFDSKIYYPPLYEREVWHHQETDAILVRRANLNVDEQGAVFNSAMLNIIKNCSLRNYCMRMQGSAMVQRKN